MQISLDHRYVPLGACLDVFKDRSPELVIVGPAGTGKSRACLEKVHLMAMLNPGMRGLIVRKTQTSLAASGLVTFRRDVIAEAEAAGVVSWYGGSGAEPAQYRYRNGAQVVVGGMDKASKIMSTEYDLIFVQEATELTQADWEALTSRLRSGVVSFQQLLADCNPDSETHWLRRRALDGACKMINSRHEDNPRLFASDGSLTGFGKDYVGRLDRLTGTRRRRLRDGEWSSAEGAVYETFDSAVHLIDRFDIPDDWDRYLSVDFGYTNPFVAQWWTADGDGRLYLYREIYMTERLVDDHAQTILAHIDTDTAGEPIRFRKIICDHDAEGRAQLHKKLKRATTAANKKVIDGIQAVQARLAVADDGHPRLYLMRDAVIERDPSLRDRSLPASTEEEVGSYVWDRVDGRAPKEAPVKENDHGMDALRYMVADRDLATGQAVPRVRRLQ